MRALFRRRLEALGRFVIVGAMVGAAVGWLIQQIDGGPLPPHMLRGTAAGVMIGTLLGVGEEFLFIGRRLWRSHRRITALRVVLYTLAVVTTLVVVNGVSDWLTSDASLFAAAVGYVGGPTIVRDLVLAVIVAMVGTALLEVRRLHNPGDIRGFLMGRYRFPVEETRIFLFADLAGSTALAERLGPHDYSRLLGDCYRDMSEAILAWRGKIYQYVGDGIIVTWPFERAVADAACIRCFFDMRAGLASSQERYRRIYDCTPLFRGGIHGGRVVTTWVGSTKMELASHGDALNATARIQGLCKEHDAACLVTGAVLRSLSLPEGMTARNLGTAALRGREKTVELFAVASLPPST